VTLSANATATLTLVATGPDGSRVVPTTSFVNLDEVPLSFVVQYPTSDVDPSLSYQLFASISDGANAWILDPAQPVITKGNPTQNLALLLTYEPDLALGEVSGTITGVPADALGSEARWEAFLVRADTAEVVAYDAGAIADPSNIAFMVPFDPAGIDPAVQYMVVGRVVDGDQSWSGPGVAVITQGAPFSGVQVPVSQLLDPNATLLGVVPDGVVAASPAP